MQRILLNISGETVQIDSDWIEILEVLKKDFWSFLGSTAGEGLDTNSISISIFRSTSKPEIPELVASMQTQNALTYDVDLIRYCDYYGKVYTKVNFLKMHAEVFGTDFERVHEITYLLILSLAGKRLDLKGLHKLHAFAVSFNNTALVCMMPSKGGKSTLLSEMLKDKRIKMISDDIPLIDTFGCVRAFPLKLGVNELSEGLDISDPEKNIYKMRREVYGEKILICTRGLEGRIESTDKIFKNIILAEAFRFNSSQTRIIPMSLFKSLRGLFKHGVLGLGSPMIIEYFWESGWNDFFKKFKIFTLRCVAFCALGSRSRRIEIHSGSDIAMTSQKLITYLEIFSKK